MNDLSQLENILRYEFKNKNLLIQALTHRSYNKNHNEKMEFVGDSILNFVIAINLYNIFPTLSEGELSKIRAELVNQKSLVQIANEIDLGKFLFLGDGEEKSGGRKRDSILADTLEAIFAAINLDSNIDKARLVIEELYKVNFLNAKSLLLKDDKSILQEYLQSRKLNLPEYIIIKSEGPQHDTVFKVECVIKELNLKAKALGKSKKEASQSAAKKVLKLIQGKKIRDS